MKKKATPPAAPPTQPPVPAETPFLLYAGDDEKVHVRVLVHGETLWLPQRPMAELFQTTADNISLHLKNIYAEGELVETATTEDFSAVQNEGGRAVRRKLRHYNLDAIIAVGYRVSSRRATQFRIWATGILKEYIKKGFVLDDERLKQGKQVFDEDYFLELLERVRSIRASERRIYQQITDCSPLRLGLFRPHREHHRKPSADDHGRHGRCGGQILDLQRIPAADRQRPDQQGPGR